MTKPGLFFLDSDIFVLFAGVNLLRDLVAASGFELASARRLEPLFYMLRHGKRLSKKYPVGIRERATAWCSQVAPMTSRPRGMVFEQLATTRGIDPGEAELFAAVAETPGSLIATGDRRACRALRRSEDLGNVRAMLQGRIVCLETALSLLLERKSFPALSSALTQIREHNKTLGVLLSQGELTPVESFRDGLDSYSRDLTDELGELLYQP